MELLPFLQSIAYLAAVCGFIWYLRKDSQDDYNKLDTKLEVWRKESSDKLDAWRNESMSLIRAIQEETKDFHGRLCAIEEKNRGIK